MMDLSMWGVMDLLSKYVTPELTRWLVYLAQWFTKYGSKHKQGWQRVKKVAKRRSKHELYAVFSTLSLLVCVYLLCRYVRKVDCWY